MREYGSVSPMFWIGKTGKQLRGNPELQVLALYLLTSPHSNMIGVYHVPVMYIGHETGIGLEAASKGLASLAEYDFCTYCHDTETIWVHEFAKYQVGEELKESDNRCKAIQRQYSAIKNDEIRTGFYARYGDSFHLHAKELTSPLEGAIEGATVAPLSCPVPVPVNNINGKKKTVSARKAKTAIPDDFSISDSVRDWADRNGHKNLEKHLAHFVNAAKANGYTYLDWDSAFRNAISGNWAKISVVASGGDHLTEIFARAI